MKAPIAKQIAYEHNLHGDTRQDPYYWLKDKENQEVLDYLSAENEYFKHVMSPLKSKADKIFEDMVTRIPDSETQVPIQRGSYFYYSRLDKDKQYPIYVRKRAATRAELEDADEEILLDENTLVENDDDYLQVTLLRVSNDHNKLAYLENRDGTDNCTLYIKDLTTGELLEDKIPNVYLFSSVEWSKCDQFLFYIVLDDKQRPYQLWRHKLESSINDDVLLYEEQDETFTLFIELSQSKKYIFAISDATETSEVRLIDTVAPKSAPVLFNARETGVLYYVEHWRDHLLIVTNKNQKNFELLNCPVDDINNQKPLVPYDENRFLQYVYPFKNTLIVVGRENGLTQLWTYKDGQLEQMTWDEDIYTVSLVQDQSYTTDEILVEYVSLITPKTTYSLDVATSERTVLQIKPVSGEYDADNFRQEQHWATAEDGVKVPLMMVYHKDAFNNGPAPLILEAYGSYGSNSNAYFSPYSIDLLETGVVLVTANIRGGSEMGRHWYEDGKMQNKRNSFTDFIAAADYLIEQDFTSAEKMAARGGSAGGLLVGAVANMAGDRFKVIVPEVPFVDVVTTMLDDSLPLTTLEWDEWGNPNKKEDYLYMKSYSPYDNVERQDYPHMYVTAGLNDPRVSFFEPAKWVARLRDMKTDNNTLVLKTHMGAGHFGSSGRMNYLREEAECLAFVLDKIDN